MTTFSNIELVRVLENNRNSSLDLKALSDNVAAAVGTNGLAAEGLDVLLTTTPSTTYSIDKNNNGAIAASEITTATAVLGVENITTGNANDRVTLDQTQATANNVIDLGAQQDNSEALTLREGADVVTVNHADVTNDGVVDATDVPLRPTLTLAVQGTSLSQLTATAGALGKASFTDTFKNVEVVNLVDAATSTRYNDVLDAAGTGGATGELRRGRHGRQVAGWPARPGDDGGPARRQYAGRGRHRPCRCPGQRVGDGARHHAARARHGLRRR